MATRLNLMVDQGSDFRTTILLEDANGPIDLTTYTAEAQFRQHFSSAQAYNLDVELANNGIVTILLPATRSKNIRYGRYVYDVFLTSDQGALSRIVEGILTLNPQVTRANEEVPITVSIVGPDGVPYSTLNAPVEMTATVNVTPNNTTYTAVWQYNFYDAEQNTFVWQDIVTDETFTVDGLTLTYTPTSEDGVNVRLLITTDTVVPVSELSNTAAFYYSPV